MDDDTVSRSMLFTQPHPPMPPKQKEGTKKGSREFTVLPAEPSKESALKKFPQELIQKIIDEIPSKRDLKTSSLVGRNWTCRSQQKLFRHIVINPLYVKGWLNRSEETCAAMAPWIIKFELAGSAKQQWGVAPWDEPSVLTRLIGSLASSPIQHLAITPFHMGRFRKTSLIRCFQPIAKSLCSLELKFVKTCTPALVFLISMFPNLDDVLLERVTTAPMVWTPGGYDSEYIPSFAGTFEYLDLNDSIRPGFLSWIMDYPLWFHTISPGMLAKDDVFVFAELVKMCASTLQEIPHVMFDANVKPEHLRDILNPCTNLRRVGVYGGEFGHTSPIAETMVLSLRSRHISVIYVEIVETLRTLQVDLVWNDQGWQRFEDFLCQLDEEREDDSEPLVLELGIWRNPQLKTSGPLDPGKILPRFRKRGLIRFAAPPEDPDFASVLNVKYSDWGIAAGLPLALAQLLTG